MSTEGLDREDPTVAERILRALLPKKGERSAVLAQLIRSCASADRFSSESWAVTLFENGLRVRNPNFTSSPLGRAGTSRP